MDPSHNSGDVVSSLPSSTRPTTILAVIIICLQILISLATYPFLPPIVPSHWNAAGQIDGYMPKALNAILLPAISLGVYLLVRLLLAAGPKLGAQNQRATLPVSEYHSCRCTAAYAGRATDYDCDRAPCSSRCPARHQPVHWRTAYSDRQLPGEATPQLLDRD